MNLGMWYVWNMHESCVSKIHPFSGHAKQDIETVMKRCCLWEGTGGNGRHPARARTSENQWKRTRTNAAPD